MPKKRISNLFKIASLVCVIFLANGLTQPANAQFVKGADVSWLPQMEATGFHFYNYSGEETNCLQILKDKGINTIRLRVFVNPSNHKTDGHCSKDETVTMALRAQAMGMRIMIDFHYSDSWADPGKQNKPATWASHSFTQLLNDVYTHTFEVIDTLKKSGVTPEWVQVGNEIGGGMLWPDGSTNNWTQLAQLLNKGYDAVKAVDNSIQVIIHHQSGHDNAKCRWFFDNAKNKGVKYDMIGLSYYPYWIGSDYTVTIDDLENNMNDLVARYGKEVMVVEVGGEDIQVQNTYDMLVAVIKKTAAVSETKGMGVIYWEPEGERNWSGGYPLSCWSANGKPTAALNAFLTNITSINSKNAPVFNIYPNPNTGGVLNFEFEKSNLTYAISIYDLEGRLLKQQTMSGFVKNSMRLDLIPGIYLVKVDDGKYYQVRKLIVR